jgi:hypothetical protein
MAATNEHDGQISQNLSSPFPKNISLVTSGKSLLQLRPSHPTRGALANVTNVGWDAVDADVPLTNGAEVYGEVVWA